MTSPSPVRPSWPVHQTAVHGLAEQGPAIVARPPVVLLLCGGRWNFGRRNLCVFRAGGRTCGSGNACLAKGFPEFTFFIIAVAARGVPHDPTSRWLRMRRAGFGCGGRKNRDDT